MKDGTVAEAGTHDELMSKDGEYAKLYKIQADAFSSVAASTEETPDPKSLEEDEVSHLKKVQTRESYTHPTTQLPKLLVNAIPANVGQ